MKNDNVITLDQFKDIHYGKPGTEKRDKLEAGYENFKIRVLIHETRIQEIESQQFH